MGQVYTAVYNTGQVADGSTGLDYYHARYYDPVAGQFTSADTEQDGLNRYGYVRGNPTTATDPSGHRLCYGDNANSCVPDPKKIRGGGCTTDCRCKSKCGGSGGDTGDGGHDSKGSGKKAPRLGTLEQLQTICESTNHPGWCQEWYVYYDDGTWGSKFPGIDEADYYWYTASGGLGMVAGITWFYIVRTGQWVKSVFGGLALDFSPELPFPATISGGWGRLITLDGGHATSSQILNFLSGGSTSLTIELFGGVSDVSNTVGESIQVGLGSGVDIGIGGGYGYTHTSGPQAVTLWKCAIWYVWCMFDN